MKKIKLFIFDVDGVLTDGSMFWNGDAGWCRFFNLHDGHGFERLREAGFEIAIISRSPYEDIKKRMELLKVQHVYTAVPDKLVAFEQLLSKLNLKSENAFYMGDDYFDLPLLKKVGFSATVSDAMPLVKKSVDHVTKLPGGRGAAREVIELFLNCS